MNSTIALVTDNNSTAGDGLAELGESDADDVPFVNATGLAEVAGIVLINEVELNPEGSDSGSEWIELYNPGEIPANTTGLAINASETTRVEMPKDITVEPGETRVISLENVSLPNVVEMLTLVNSSSGEVLDSTPSLVDRTDDDNTWQRIPDGNDEWEFREQTQGNLNDPDSADSNNTVGASASNLSDSCIGNAGCVQGIAIRIVDGNTLYVISDGEVYKVELALVNTPEREDERFIEATMFTRSLCLGSPVLVDQDDGQLVSDGSVIATVYCSSIGLNEELLDNGFASLDADKCGTSEFARTEWAQQYGC
ncbi:MAG TPA: thermonuclease family protein [Nitrososphaera sp.]|nr:thermonuclease family protein [Nitrososphaera sp.]